jgi:hypothetical protein
MNETTTENTEENTTPESANASPQLSIQDLQNLRAIIDLAVRRGAFGASEVSSVGQVYDRLNTFLVAVAPQDNQSVQK